jgi:acyl dehydratase
MNSAARSELLSAEDIPIGQLVDLGHFSLTANDIIEFGARWDPLPLHLSEASAQHTAFGRLVASGVQTLAVFQRLAVLSLYSTWDIFAGRRIDDVRFLGPVFPGDALHGVISVVSIDSNHQDRSLVTCKGWLETATGRVLQLNTESYVNRRTPVVGNIAAES